MTGHILYITDGSYSSRMAGLQAIQIALSRQTALQALFIVDESWRDILGDEWMSNSLTRMQFYRWFEAGVQKYADEILIEFANRARQQGVIVETAIKTGRFEKVVLTIVSQTQPALLVLPNPHATGPAAACGLKFNLHRLAQKIPCPVLTGPNTTGPNTTEK
jgi:nucleotide-binding universal stress UspA family protein